MPHKPEARQRLASLMEARRAELGLRWQDVADDGDLSIKTLYSARHPDGGDITPLTQGKIDVGLCWEHGSVKRILEGKGDPVPLRGSRADVAPSPQSRRPQTLPVPDADAAAPSIRDSGEIPVITADPGELSPYIDAVWGEIGHAKAAHGPHPAGVQVFPGDVHEARMWDREELSEAERVRLVSFIRMMTARYRRGTNGHGQQAS